MEDLDPDLDMSMDADEPLSSSEVDIDALLAES